MKGVMISAVKILVTIPLKVWMTLKRFNQFLTNQHRLHFVYRFDERT